jgi:hypothetical protein
MVIRTHQPGYDSAQTLDQIGEDRLDSFASVWAQ